MQRRWLLLFIGPAAASALLAWTHSAAREPRLHVAMTPSTTGAAPVGAPFAIGGEPAETVDPSKTGARAVDAPDTTVAQLLTTDLAADPENAPAAIHLLAERARGTRDHEEAARALTRWLREETRRDEAGARGNVPNLIEALGELGGDLAVNALVDALGDDRHELSIKTLIVQELGELRDPRAARAISRFAAVAANTPVTNDLEAALRAEALAAADESGRRIHTTDQGRIQ